MNQAISFLPNDMGEDIPMIQVLLYIILTILAFIFVVINRTIIEEQATVIGTLLASGYTKKELIHHYMILPTVIIVISSIIGNIFGYLILPPVFANMYYDSYCLPPFHSTFVMEAFLATTIIPFLLMTGIQWIRLRYILRISPLRFLRKDLHKPKKTKYIHLKRKDFFNRFRMRIILQNKGSYLTLIIGIFFATFIFIFGIMLTPTLDHYIDETRQSVKTNYQYLLKAPIEATGEKLTITTLETYYKFGDLDLDVTFYGIGDHSMYYDDLELPKKKNEIMISSDFANKMFLEIGDDIVFENTNTNETYKLKVKDIYDYHAGFSVFLRQSYLNELLQQDKSYFNGYISNEKLDINEQYLVSSISRNDFTKIGKQMTEVFSQMVPIMTFVSLAIYFVVMYILTKLVMDRNRNHISFLKVMGYTNEEIKKLYLHATTYVVLFSLIISLPICGVGMYYILQIAFMRFACYIELYLPLPYYLLTLVIGCVTYFIIQFILTKRVDAIDLGNILKENE